MFYQLRTGAFSFLFPPLWRETERVAACHFWAVNPPRIPYTLVLWNHLCSLSHTSRDGRFYHSSRDKIRLWRREASLWMEPGWDQVYRVSKFEREHFENPKRYFNPDFVIADTMSSNIRTARIFRSNRYFLYIIVILHDISFYLLKNKKIRVNLI